MIETMSKIGDLIDQNKLLEQQNEELRKIIDINLNQSKPSKLVSFIDTIDINEVENLIIKFYQYNKIPTAIYDKNHKLLFSVGWKPVCVKYHHCRLESQNHCRKSIEYINKQLSLKPYKYFQCNNGLNAIAIPVIIRETHVATLVLSQFLYQGEKIDYELFTKQAELFNFDLKNYLHAIESLPTFTSDEINQITNNITYLAELIAYLGLKNMETHEKTVNHLENELILSALRDKISEQEIILKSFFQNVMDHDNEIRENSISKTDQAKELEKLNEKLERTEFILNNLLTSLPLGICFVRKDVFTFVNDHMFKITGYTSKELTGRSPEFLFGPENRYFDLLPSSMKFPFIKNNHSFELTLMTKENRSVSILAFSSLLENNDPQQGWIISILDISDLKKVHKKLTAPRERPRIEG